MRLFVGDSLADYGRAMLLNLAGIAVALLAKPDALTASGDAEDRSLCGRYTQPAHRVELFASDEAHRQMLRNLARRLFGLPILTSSGDAAERARRSFLRSEAQAAASRMDQQTPAAPIVAAETAGLMRLGN
jgi:hypothetical protein